MGYRLLDTTLTGPKGFLFILEVKIKNQLKLKKVHHIVYVNFPFVTIEDVSEIINSLAENPDVKIDEWQAADIASFVMDILGDL